MEASKERNGSKLLGILAIGRKTAKMDLVFSFIKMEINTRACGKVISVMAKAHIGETKLENLEENILEIGLKIKNMEEEPFSTKTEIDMMVTG